MTVFWDWNGTLIDDTELTLAIENELFKERGFRKVEMTEYLQHFTFPVVDYYRWLGVPEDVFNAMNDEWLAAYASRCNTCSLGPTIPETVRRIQEHGHRQVIISASEQSLLRKQVAAYPELDGVFDQVLGLQDAYARSKVQRALDFLKSDGTDPANAVFLGDTCHDAEVAAAIGCRCVLIAHGHQAPNVLAKMGVPVVNSAKEAADLLKL